MNNRPVSPSQTEPISLNSVTKDPEVRRDPYPTYARLRATGHSGPIMPQ